VTRARSARLLFMVVFVMVGPFAFVRPASACEQRSNTDCSLFQTAGDCRSSLNCPDDSNRHPHKQSTANIVEIYARSRDPRVRSLYNQYKDHVAACKNLRAGRRQNTAQYRKFCTPQQLQPQLTEDIVREQFRRLPLPRGDLIFQPSWGALVNKKEIFYTRAERDHDYRMTLLGHQVVLHSHVQSYTWTWGDGSADGTFDGPGGPYPDFDVAHTYTKPATCTVSLALTYSATYTVDGGPVQQVQGTATVPGAPVDVRVVTAHAVLVQGGH
jgi:hypothetical protein